MRVLRSLAILFCSLGQFHVLALHVPSFGATSVVVHRNTSTELPGHKAAEVPSSRKLKKLFAKQHFFVSFDVCNGAAVQHTALVHGIAIAYAMGAILILPDLFTSYNRFNSSRILFHEIYDENWLRNSLKNGVTIISKNEIQLPGQPELMDAYRKQQSLGQWKEIGDRIRNQGKNMLHLTCTYGSVSALKENNAIELLWKIQSAIRPAPLLAQIVDTISNQLHEGSPTGRFSALHLRVEPEWINHCRVEDSYNCMLNSDNLHSVFAIERVPLSDPLYIAGGLTRPEFDNDTRFLNFRGVYRDVMKQDIMPDIFNHFSLDNHFDVLGVIDFYICREADIFIGNGLSVFSALIELERKRPQYNNLWPKRRAFHYNGGLMPLSAHMPVDATTADGSLAPMHNKDKVKWVFTIGTGLSKLFFEHVKVSVLSAIANTTLLPTCVYTGIPKGSPHDVIERWLISVGVVVLRHSPKWDNKVQDAFAMMPPGLNTTSSTNFGSVNALLATYLRLDIPIMGFVDNYILYADVDTLFVSDPTWNVLGHEGFPKAYTMGSENIESTNPWDGNAGVMVLNLYRLGESYKEFVDMSFSKEYAEKGLVYNGQPADQGAYKAMYHEETTLVSKPPFNWRPYWKAPDKETFEAICIVHFIGPKIPDYNVYFGNGSLTNPLFKGIIDECHTNLEDCHYWVYKWTDTYVDCVQNSKPCGWQARSQELQKTALGTTTYSQTN